MIGLTNACIVKTTKTPILLVSVVFLCLIFMSQAKASPNEDIAAVGTVVGATVDNHFSDSASDDSSVARAQDNIKENLVVVVANDNPINALSKKELIDIYMGRYKTFPDSRLAEAIDYPAGSAIKQRFYALLVDRSERKINAYWSRLLFSGRATPPKSTNSPEEVASELINNPNGLAYMPEHAVTTEMKIVYRL